MPESSVVVRPEPMDSGSYTASSRLQAAGLRRAITLFEQAAEVVPIPRSPRPIVIADYGAATGHNSLSAISAAVAVLRKRTRPEHSVLVTHTDVPENDFTQLFRTLNEDPDSYLKKDAAVFGSAVGRSFYTQIVPSNSVNLAWSAWSIQWLARTPSPVGDHVVVALGKDEAVRTAYARQAAHDWHEFVAFRGRELSPGGRLVVMTMAIGDDGDFGYRPLLEAISATLTDLVARQLLTGEEADAMTIPIVGRRARDFLSPFAPSGTFEKLTVEHLEVFDAEDRFWAQYRTDRKADALGAKWAGFLGASALPHMVADLPADRRAGVLDALHSGIAQRVAASPSEVRIPLALVVIEKKQRPQG
ncbi:SAM-dependent methyltransferase [Mycolicibacterium sp. 050158]|uniref:SAM-dependent methyltransferase n=1 Tax=Mycolicibacterium sp. 050158 TaxID=3090602 RepID=UPI00299D59DE|nr:SAM-dependent methyltransferase [Mycolicibacterium sp. 050158]MDX1891101.1 SAM-dependent methyltransferase [Mycolicibacterium sp. 050158]